MTLAHPLTVSLTIFTSSAKVPTAALTPESGYIIKTTASVQARVACTLIDIFWEEEAKKKLQHRTFV